MYLLCESLSSLSACFRLRELSLAEKKEKIKKERLLLSFSSSSVEILKKKARMTDRQIDRQIDFLSLLFFRGIHKHSQRLRFLSVSFFLSFFVVRQVF